MSAILTNQLAQRGYSHVIGTAMASGMKTAMGLELPGLFVMMLRAQVPLFGTA